MQAVLRSREAFTLRRCQILLTSAEQQRPSQIASALGCAVQSVRNWAHANRPIVAPGRVLSRQEVIGRVSDYYGYLAEPLVQHHS